MWLKARLFSQAWLQESIQPVSLFALLKHTSSRSINNQPIPCIRAPIWHTSSLSPGSLGTEWIPTAQVPKTCTGVPEAVMNPSNAWSDKEDFDSTLRHLADLYNDNFAKYASGGGFVSKDLAARIVTAGPKGQQRTAPSKKATSNGNV